MNEKNEQLIHFDEAGFKSQVSTLEDFLPFFESCISDLNKLGIGEFQEKDFIYLFLDPKLFLMNAFMTGKPVEIGGMPVSRLKIFDLFEKPKGYVSLLAKLGELGEKINKVPRYYKFKPYENTESFLEYFEFSKGKIELKKETIEDVKYSHGIFITKDSSKEIYKFIKDLERLFNESDIFLKNLRPPFYRSDDFIKRFLSFDTSSKKFNLNIDTLKSVDNGI